VVRLDFDVSEVGRHVVGRIGIRIWVIKERVKDAFGSTMTTRLDCCAGAIAAEDPCAAGAGGRVGAIAVGGRFIGSADC
jgi:hypothetical protein